MPRRARATTSYPTASASTTSRCSSRTWPSAWPTWPPSPAGARLELDLVDRKAELVQAADARLDRVAVPRRQFDLGVELLPELAVAALDALGLADRVVVVLAGRIIPAGEGGQVGQSEGHVLDEHFEVVLTLAVG